MGKRMRVDGMHTWSFPSGFLPIQTIYGMCLSHKERSSLAPRFARPFLKDVNEACVFEIYFTLLIQITCRISFFQPLWAWVRTLYSRYPDSMKYLSHKLKLRMEPRSNCKLSIHGGIWADWRRWLGCIRHSHTPTSVLLWMEKTNRPATT